MKTALIIGSTGLIGSDLVKLLIAIVITAK
jgi:uncharacterized protein YbjT (DUF2867 family)